MSTAMGSDSSMVSGAWAPCLTSMFWSSTSNKDDTTIANLCQEIETFALHSFGCTIVTPFAKFYETAILHKNLDLEIDMVLDVFSHLAISAFNSVDPGKCTSMCQYDQLTESQFLLPLHMAYWNEESQDTRNVMCIHVKIYIHYAYIYTYICKMQMSMQLFMYIYHWRSIPKSCIHSRNHYKSI